MKGRRASNIGEPFGVEDSIVKQNDGPSVALTPMKTILDRACDSTVSNAYDFLKIMCSGVAGWLMW